MYNKTQTPSQDRLLNLIKELRAKQLVKLSKRKDYYMVLNIEKSANEADIKKAYRKMALLHHPDRHVNSSVEDKIEQERIFKNVGQAYAILSDPRKKARHDQGQDLDNN